MREEYLGSESDQRYVRAYLANIRELDPIEISTAESPIALSNTDEIGRWIDIDLFTELTKECLDSMSTDSGISISPLERSRYYVALTDDLESIGGFFDERSVGYQHWYRAGFVFMLRQEGFSSKTRTIELARSYLHDCLHAETFVSFRRAVRCPAASSNAAKRRMPEVYREQYGFNFRNQDGRSYSSPQLTAMVPQAINLNLLMDGVIEQLLARKLKKIAPRIDSRDELEQSVYSEVVGEEQGRIKAASRYRTEVVLPTSRFITHWGGEHFAHTLLNAMLTGELNDLKRHFERITGITGAWEKRFRCDDFQLPPNPKL